MLQWYGCSSVSVYIKSSTAAQYLSTYEHTIPWSVVFPSVDPTLYICYHLTVVPLTMFTCGSGVLQSRAAGVPGGDERREAGLSGRQGPGSQPWVPHGERVHQDDGEKVRNSRHLGNASYEPPVCKEFFSPLFNQLGKFKSNKIVFVTHTWLADITVFLNC